MMKKNTREKPIQERSLEELARRQQEIELIGNQYAMNGSEPPDALSTEYVAIARELSRRGAGPKPS